MKLRPRRSVLYMPGSNARALEKARGLPADALILDLEDAVAPDAKITARRQIKHAIEQGGYGRREVIVRCNGLDTPWGIDDLKELATAGADAILLPKVENPDQLSEALVVLGQSGAPAGLSLWAMIETPRAILNIDRIATAHKQLEVLVMGTSDLARELRVRHSPDRLGLLGALSHCVLSARACGLSILDGVQLDLDDDDGYRKVCAQGRDLGFDGKTLIHPKQIEAANRIFAPDEAAVAAARRVIAAWQQASAAGHGVVVVDGRLVENLHVEEARYTLALAEAIEEIEQP